MQLTTSLRASALVLALGLAAAAAPAAATTGAATTATAGSAAPERDGDRLRPLVVDAVSGVDVEIVASGEGDALTADLRRVDGVGSTFPGPDGHGTLTSAGWGDIGGRRCVAVASAGTLDLGDLTSRDVAFGFAGRSIARVVVELDDGTRVGAGRGRRSHEGLRGWVADTPAGSVIARVEGWSADGRRVAVVEDVAGSGGFGSAPTC